MQSRPRSATGSKVSTSRIERLVWATIAVAFVTILVQSIPMMLELWLPWIRACLL